MLFRVVADDVVLDGVFDHPLAAVTRAITQSMSGPRTFRVLVNDTVVCAAKGGELFAASGGTGMTPADAVRLAEQVVKLPPRR